jgi:uncharacterized protein (TIGR02611 family)
MSPPDPPNGNVFSRALFSVRGRVHRLPAGETVWRVGIALIGLVIVVVGVILLPLPGPGWLIIFLGIGIWATEFAWATRLLRRARIAVSQFASWVNGLPRWLQLLVGAAGFAVVAMFATLGWLWVWRR